MAEQIKSFQDVQGVLGPLTVDKGIKAQAFDSFFDASDEGDFKKRFDKLTLPKEAKARLWDLKYGREQERLAGRRTTPTPPQVGRVALAEAPAIGATVGALAGYGVPGAVAGGALGQAVKRRFTAGPPPQAGEFAQDIGLEGLKQGAFQAAGPIAGKLLGRPLERGSESLYRGLIKPKDLSIPEEAAVVRRGLETKTPAYYPKGAERAEARVAAAKPQVTAKVAQATKAGATIPTDDIMRPLDEQIKLWGADDPADAIPLIKQKQRIMEKLRNQGMDQWVTPEEAQRLKEDLGRQLSSKAFKKGAPAPSKITGKTARYEGLKGEIEKAVPGVEPINRAIHLDLALKNAITEAERRNPGWLKGTIPTLLGAGALTAIGHTGWAEGIMVAHLVREAVSRPGVLSKLAIALNRAGVVMPKIGTAVGYGARFGTPLLEDMPPTRFEDRSGQNRQ